MGRKPCCAKEGMTRGAWTAIEDKVLVDYIKEYGEGKWRNIPKLAGLKRCGKSCRLRWLNYLRPDIKRGNISSDEEDLIVRLHKLLGNRWSLIAGRLPGRTDNEIKNYWNTNLSKKTPKRQLNKADDKKKPMLINSPPRKIDFPRPSKCKKTIMATTQQQGMMMTVLANNGDTSNNVAKIVPSTNPIMMKNMAMELDHSQDSSLFGLKSDSFSDFSMDFDMGEICLSDVLGPDYCAQNVTLNDHGCNNNVCYLNNSDDPTMFPDQTVYVPEKFAGTWREKDYVRVNEDPDFRALATFFDSSEEWLEIDQN